MKSDTTMKARNGSRAKLAAVPPAPAPPAEPGPFVTLDDVVQMAPRILSARNTRKLAGSDPRFPQPLFGRGHGVRPIWARAQVLFYFQRLAEEGPAPAA